MLRRLQQYTLCGNYGNSLLYFFDKNFVRATFLLTEELISRNILSVVEKQEILSHYFFFREINYLVTSVKKLLSRNFCQKCASQCGKTRNSLIEEIFREINSSVSSIFFSKSIVSRNFCQESVRGHCGTEIYSH